jgi:hypothetical protein
MKQLHSPDGRRIFGRDHPENTGHRVKPESQRAAMDRFVKWLKP